MNFCDFRFMIKNLCSKKSINVLRFCTILRYTLYKTIYYEV